MKETIGRNINVFMGDFSLCVFEIQHIMIGCDLKGYMLSYYSLVKKSLFLNMRKNL